MTRRKAQTAASPAPLTPSDAPWPADNVERWPLERLLPYARNARKHSDAQVAQIAAAIREWGWTVPVLVDEEGTIIAGHGRVMAARLLGIETVPVMVARGWSDGQKRAYVIADNKLTLNADWDVDLLKIELADLKGMSADLGLIGFSTDELSELVVGFEPPDPAKASSPGGADAGSAYREQYGVIVICRDEGHQKAVFDQLIAEGMDVRVVAT